MRIIRLTCSGRGALLGLGLGALLALAPGVGRAEEPQRQRVTQECTVLANGDIRLVHTVRLGLRAYNALKDEVRNTDLLLRQLGLTSQATLFRDARATYDDAERAVRVEALMVGGAKSRGSLWHIPVSNAAAQEVLEQEGDHIRLLSIAPLADGSEQIVTTTLRFPPGTQSIRFDAAAGRVEVALPVPKHAPRGSVTLAVEIEAKREIMACLAKVYGLPDFTTFWVARAVVRNVGDGLAGGGAARDLGVRFRVQGYSEWSAWQRSAWLYPGQTAVEAYHPILLPAVNALTSEAPSRLEVEWTWTLPDGRTEHGQDERPLTVLGMNDVVWSSLPASESTTWREHFDHAPLIAATFVTHTDPVVQRFAGMAAALAGGVPATRDDASAVRFLSAVYALMAGNAIAYQSPPGLLKENLRQHVKYARDVLRNRAGTCIDLAILVASTCQAGGLDPLLVFVPGHAFPAVRLPSGELLPLESTAISAPPEGKALPFQRALELGEKQMDQALEHGLYLLCDVTALRARGVPPPELPELAGNPLEDWGIGQHGAPGTPEPGSGPADVEGTWRHPSGAYLLALPPGWRAEAKGGGVDLASQDPAVSGGVRVHPREGTPSARAHAETMAWRIVLLPNAGGGVRRATAHVEGTTADKRHARSSVSFEVASDGKVVREDYHFLVGREQAYSLWVQAPGDAWERLLPTLRAVVNGFAIAEEGLPSPAKAERFRDPDGRFELDVPAGWSATGNESGEVRLSLREDAGRLVVRSEARTPRQTNADVMARDLVALIGRQEAAQGNQVEVRNQSRGVGGGAKIAYSSVLFDTLRPGQRPRRRELHAFLGSQTLTLIVMDAPEPTWMLWLPSFRQMFRSLTLHDTPLPGADAAAPDRASPAPPATPEPPKPPEQPEQPEPPERPKGTAPRLRLYEDPALLFTLNLPEGWKVEGQPMGVNASSPTGNAIVSLTLGVRAGDDHDVYVARVLERMPSSFPGWKEQGRAVGGGEGVNVTRLEAAATIDGTLVDMRIDLTTGPAFHQLLLLVCPRAQIEAHAPLWDAVLEGYGVVTGGWPAEQPLVRLRSVTSARQPYALEVPTSWRVVPEGLDVVASAPHGDALVVARATPRVHETIDAQAEAVLAGMRSRRPGFELLSQEVHEQQGRSVLVARVRDGTGDDVWERELHLVQTPKHDLLLVLACRADLRFKWDALLARIAAAWSPGP